MAHEKDERGAAMLKKTTDAGDDFSKKAAANPRSAPRESGNGAPQPPPSGRRPERYIIGTRTSITAPAFLQPQHSMDDVVTYLEQQGNVEVLKRIKLGGTRPFTVDGRSVGEIVLATIDEGKAQRLRAGAPPDLIIERDSMLSVRTICRYPAELRRSERCYHCVPLPRRFPFVSSVNAINRWPMRPWSSTAVACRPRRSRTTPEPQPWPSSVAHSMRFRWYSSDRLPIMGPRRARTPTHLRHEHVQAAPAWGILPRLPRYPIARLGTAADGH